MNIVETWAPIAGTDVETSSFGRVRRIITPYLHSNGYLQVKIGQGNKARNFFVHRLVALSFLGPCPEGMEVNHKDLDKKNNRPENLEYVTHQKNQMHMTKNGKNYLISVYNKERKKT